MIKIWLSLITIVYIAVLLEIRCEARNIGDHPFTQFGKIIRNDSNDKNSSCKCSDESCECCSIVGPSKMCNVIKLVNLDQGEDLALELSVHIGRSKIFSQNVTLRELEPICYPYGNYNLCVQIDPMKREEDNVKVCGNFLAKHKDYDNVEDSILVKTEIFCLPSESHQLNEHVLQLLRFVSQ